MKNRINTLVVILLSFLIAEIGYSQSKQFYDVTAGANNGIRFYSGSDYYKLSFGNTALNHFGPVTSWSMLSTTSSHSGRGWAWGVKGATPVAALQNTGNLAVKGWLRSMNEELYLGNYSNSKKLHTQYQHSLIWKSNHSNQSQFILTDKEGKRYGSMYANTNGTYFGLLDGDANWSYVTKLDEWTQLRVDNQDVLTMWKNGKVRIGGNTVNTSSNDYRLFVDKGILTEVVKVAVKNSADWSDYVFNEDYELMPLSDLRNFLKTEKHLPNVPSADEMVENGLDVAKSDAVLLEKIEEAHLYILKLHEQMEIIPKLQEQIEKMNTQIEDLQEQVKGKK